MDSSYRPFVIIATQRSGSTLLVKSLDSVPTILCAGEIFHDGPNILHPEWRYPQEVLGSRLIGRVADRFIGPKRVSAHIQKFFSQERHGLMAVGFKLMTSQLHRFNTLLSVLLTANVTRLFLYRDDSFAAAISNFRAMRSGVYHSDRVRSRSSMRPVTVHLSEFRDYVSRSNTHKQELLKLHSIYGGTLVAYERLISNWDQEIINIGNAIGVPRLRVAQALDKVGSASEPLPIANLDELHRAFGSMKQESGTIGAGGDSAQERTAID